MLTNRLYARRWSLEQKLKTRSLIRRYRRVLLISLVAALTVPVASHIHHVIALLHHSRPTVLSNFSYASGPLALGVLSNNMTKIDRGVSLKGNGLCLLICQLFLIGSVVYLVSSPARWLARSLIAVACETRETLLKTVLIYYEGFNSSRRYALAITLAYPALTLLCHPRFWYAPASPDSYAPKAPRSLCQQAHDHAPN